jgi:predicted dehydrogenase
MTSSSTSAAARRYAVVGAGARAAMYVDALAGEYADVGRIVALCDTNATRMRFHDERLRAAGHPSPTTYGPERFAQLLDAERPEVVVVTSPDHTHHRYADAALEAGCEVIVEKPLTTSVEGARAIAQAAATSSGELIVTFNYRYAPRNRVLREVVADGRIGEVTSVHFEWVLDTVHGADYFRRWHRDKEHSGGLLVHKASHHFDLVNWWIDDVPTRVHAAGALRFYGDDNARVILAWLLADATLDVTDGHRSLITAITANFRTTGRTGFRGDRIDQPQLAEHGWRHYFDGSLINPSEIRSGLMRAFE